MRRTITTVPSMHNRLAGLNSKRAFALIGGLVLLAAILAGYCVYWRYVARQLETGVATWAEQQRALGNEIAFEWSGIGGFPFRFAATFRQPSIRWRMPDAEIAWNGADLDAEMAPWNLHEIQLRSDGPHGATIRLPGDPSEWHVSTTGLAGTIGLYGGGALRGLTLALRQPDLSLPNGTALASAGATIMLEIPETPPTDFQMPLARVAVDLQRIAMPPGTRLLNEDPVEAMTIDAIVKGPVPLAPPKNALTAWRDTGGVVELSSFVFAQGPLSLTGNATVALDPDLQPEGAGTITTVGLGDAVEILIRDGLIPPDRALVIRATVKALEKPGPDGRPQAKLGLSLQNRTISFGPAPLF
ncbi:MAG: DUF2125 domain-containing protein, partial [Dongiaceae bacterium]